MLRYGRNTLLERAFVCLAVLVSCTDSRENRPVSGNQAPSAPAPTALSAPRVAATTQDIVVPHGRHVGVDEFFRTYAQELKLGRDDDFKPGTSEKSRLTEFSSTRFQHVYRGLPVFGSEYIVTHTPAGEVSSGRGRIVAGLSLGSNPTVTAESALSSAKDRLVNMIGRPLPPSFEVWRKTLGFAAPRSAVFTDASAYRLVYRIVIAARPLLAEHQVDVDALSGGVVEVVSLAVRD